MRLCYAPEALGQHAGTDRIFNISYIPSLESTAERLRIMLKDEDPTIREAAAKTLGAIKKNELDFQALTAALHDQNVTVATQAAKSLAEADFHNENVKQSTGLMAISNICDFH